VAIFIIKYSIKAAFLLKMKFKKYTQFCVLFLVGFTAFGQHTYLPINTFTAHLIDRFEIKNSQLNNKYFHTSTKSYRRQAIADYRLQKPDIEITEALPNSLRGLLRQSLPGQLPLGSV
jgi:hypothetical protein